MHTSFAVPDKVTNVAVSELKNTSVTVLWNQPITAQDNLPTMHFVVELIAKEITRKRRDVTDDVTKIRAESSPVVVKDLAPYTDYTLRVGWT